MVNEEGSREYEDEDEAYRDYQGSEEYQYHYDGDDYPSYEEDYSEEQVCPLLFPSGRHASVQLYSLRGGLVRMSMKAWNSKCHAAVKNAWYRL